MITVSEKQQAVAENSKLLKFETPHFLQSLFANDESLLRELEQALGGTITTRDDWIQLIGDSEAHKKFTRFFDQLERTRRKGGVISSHTFRYAVNAMKKETSGEIELTEFADCQLIGSSTKQPVTPRNASQLHYVKALASSDVSFGIGPAGTGKTYLAVAFALQMLREKRIDRILLTRPAVEAGEALGFLPGDLEEKVLPYLRPLYDAISDMLEPREAQALAEKKQIEIAPLAYMRGRTLNHSCIILDEAQNTSREQMLMFLTRIGDGSKCIVTGDPSQIDLRPTNKSGLLEAIKVLKGVEGISFTQFKKEDVVRHPVVQRIIAAYDKGRELAESQGE